MRPRGAPAESGEANWQSTDGSASQGAPARRPTQPRFERRPPDSGGRTRSSAKLRSENSAAAAKSGSRPRRSELQRPLRLVQSPVLTRLRRWSGLARRTQRRRSRMSARPRSQKAWPTSLPQRATSAPRPGRARRPSSTVRQPTKRGAGIDNPATATETAPRDTSLLEAPPIRRLGGPAPLGLLVCPSNGRRTQGAG
jgi:hypothetical protein